MDALLHVGEFTPIIDYANVVRRQRAENAPTGKHRASIKQFQVPGASCEGRCVLIGTIRPYIIHPFRKIVFNSLQYFSHPGTNATAKLVIQRCIRPSVKTDCRLCGCNKCQRAKVTCHVTAPVVTFGPASSRFEHVHLDRIVMPYFEGQRRCLTMVDRFLPLPKVIPIPDDDAITVARGFLHE